MTNEMQETASDTGERAQAVDGLVVVVRSIVEKGHYDNSPEGSMACDVYDWEFNERHGYGRNRGSRPACTCGWDEAKAALDAYEATQTGGSAR